MNQDSKYIFFFFNASIKTMMKQAIENMDIILVISRKPHKKVEAC
jgi:hypothetical protein